MYDFQSPSSFPAVNPFALRNDLKPPCPTVRKAIIVAMRPSRNSSTPFPLQQLVSGNTYTDVMLSYGKETKALLDYAITQLANPGDTVVAVSVLPQNDRNRLWASQMMQHLQAALRTQIDVAEARNIKVSLIIRTSSPSLTLTGIIAREAATHKAVFVVVGATPSRKRFLNLHLGSSSDSAQATSQTMSSLACALPASCTVMLVGTNCSYPIATRGTCTPEPACCRSSDVVPLGQSPCSVPSTVLSDIHALLGSQPEFSLPQLLAATDGFSPARMVGEGGAGQVFRGLLRLPGQQPAARDQWAEAAAERQERLRGGSWTGGGMCEGELRRDGGGRLGGLRMSEPAMQGEGSEYWSADEHESGRGGGRLTWTNAHGEEGAGRGKNVAGRCGEPGGEVMEVAVKRLKLQGMAWLDRETQFHVKQFMNEVRVLQHVQHPNLLSMLGACATEEELLVVFEWMPNGSLEDRLTNNRLPPLSWHQRLLIASGAAQGLAFLHHSCDVIHRDIKSANVLLAADLTPVVADFGLSKFTPAGTRAQEFLATTLAGSQGYMAPEYVETGLMSKPIDVFAFGVVLLELITGRVRFHDGKNPPFLSHWARQVAYTEEFDRLADTRLNGCYDKQQLKAMAMLAVLCIAVDPRERPAMNEVAELLSRWISLKLMHGDEDA